MSSSLLMRPPLSEEALELSLFHAGVVASFNGDSCSLVIVSKCLLTQAALQSETGFQLRSKLCWFQASFDKDCHIDKLVLCLQGSFPSFDEVCSYKVPFFQDGCARPAAGKNSFCLSLSDSTGRVDDGS